MTDDHTLRDLAAAFGCLSEPARLLAVRLLAGSGEMTVTAIRIALGLSQPTVSHHLARLRSAGLVADRRAGRHVYYRIDPAGLAGALLPVLGTAAPAA